jgi:hypothetical protein
VKRTVISIGIQQGNNSSFVVLVDVRVQSDLLLLITSRVIMRMRVEIAALSVNMSQSNGGIVRHI